MQQNKSGLAFQLLDQIDHRTKFKQLQKQSRTNIDGRPLTIQQWNNFHQLLIKFAKEKAQKKSG